MIETIKESNSNDGEPVKDYSILENMEDFDKRTEVIDGVMVRHSGRFSYRYEYDAEGNAHAELVEDVEMFDSEGNRFRTNCKKEKAEELIKKYSNDEYEAVTGPKAPTRLRDGSFASSQLGDDYVGIFVKKREP